MVFVWKLSRLGNVDTHHAKRSRGSWRRRPKPSNPNSIHLPTLTCQCAHRPKSGGSKRMDCCRHRPQKSSQLCRMTATLGRRSRRDLGISRLRSAKCSGQNSVGFVTEQETTARSDRDLLEVWSLRYHTTCKGPADLCGDDRAPSQNKGNDRQASSIDGHD